VIAPILEELAVEQSEKFTIGKLDVDVNVATATKFSVMSIPTLLLFKNGEVVARLVGAKPKGALLQEIARASKTPDVHHHQTWRHGAACARSSRTSP